MYFQPSKLLDSDLAHLLLWLLLKLLISHPPLTLLEFVTNDPPPLLIH